MSLLRGVLRSLLKAVRFLHHNHLTHTDLKPENILFIDKCLKKDDDDSKETLKYE
jgi:serine/threonine protein kinase